MAIIKTGDNQPIERYYGDDGESITCAKCGDKLVVVAMDVEKNSLVCEKCDLSGEVLNAN